ncbi:MAG: isochorismate synthase MenF [Salinibacter sp.]
MPASLTPCPQFEENLDQPRRALADRVRSVLKTTSTGPRRLVRLCVPLDDPVDPISWMQAQATDEQLYWAPRSAPTGEADVRERAPEAPVVAAVGRADVLEGREHPVDYGALQRRLRARFRRADAGVRYFGGLRFDAPAPQPSRRSDAPWQSFGTYRFVLPRFEILDHASRQILACNLVVPRDADRSAEVRASIRSLALPSTASSAPLPGPVRRADRPDRDGWTAMVRWALEAIAAGRLDKVVFARKVALGLDRRVDPLRVLSHLKATTPGCFHFAFGPPSGPTFVGASPERLVRRDGREVLSEAVAGTRGRGSTPAADAALREELLTSSKERREHAFVQRAIQRALAPHCAVLEGADTPSDLALARGRHLHAPIRGTLRPGTDTTDLLEALHPTPAVGGVPADAALAAIREQEPFDRGWYAGPVGWIAPDAADFAVAIRSGLLESSTLSLFSGAGIVEGSVPVREWAEIEQKIGDFAAVLGLLGHQDGAQA